MRGGGEKETDEEVKEKQSFEDCLWCLAAEVG